VRLGQGDRAAEREREVGRAQVEGLAVDARVGAQPPDQVRDARHPVDRVGQRLVEVRGRLPGALHLLADEAEVHPQVGERVVDLVGDRRGDPGDRVQLLGVGQPRLGLGVQAPPLRLAHGPVLIGDLGQRLLAADLVHHADGEQGGRDDQQRRVLDEEPLPGRDALDQDAGHPEPAQRRHARAGDRGPHRARPHAAQEHGEERQLDQSDGGRVDARAAAGHRDGRERGPREQEHAVHDRPEPPPSPVEERRRRQRRADGQAAQPAVRIPPRQLRGGEHRHHRRERDRDADGEAGAPELLGRPASPDRDEPIQEPRKPRFRCRRQARPRPSRRQTTTSTTRAQRRSGARPQVVGPRSR
jgi:hypothetical protein